MRRHVQITRIAARHGLGRPLGISDDRGADAADPSAWRIRHPLEECGGMFVKLGQILSTRSDLLPESVARELSRLQDHVAAAPRASVEALLVAEFSERLREELDFRSEARHAAEISQRIADTREIVVPRPCS